MESYSGFAEVYDIFMDNVPYERWCEQICRYLSEYHIEPVCEKDRPVLDELAQNLYEERHTILDLGCGTGTLTRLLSKKGYSMIGVDASTEMLQVAREHGTEGQDGILYLCQDMRQLELFGTVGAVISVCDCINYLLEEKDVVETFRRVNNYLFPKGLFLFDFNTVHKYRDVIGETIIAENREDCSFIWENYYHGQNRINQYELTIFVKDESEEDVFFRMRETHYQKGYTLEEMKRFLGQAGMEFVLAADSDTMGAVTENSERIFMIARESGKSICG